MELSFLSSAKVFELIGWVISSLLTGRGGQQGCQLQILSIPVATYTSSFQCRATVRQIQPLAAIPAEHFYLTFFSIPASPSRSRDSPLDSRLPFFPLDGLPVPKVLKI
jgi:hypothetical protein